jgi:DNA polymerase III subunit delta
MTALKGKDIKSFLAQPDPQIKAILVYGDDAGAVRERSDHFAKRIIDDLKDPFNFIELTEEDLRGDKARLCDEAAALSFTGGERVIRIRGSSQIILAACDNLVKALDANTLTPNALVLVEAGMLAKSSGLRKLFEKSKKTVALPCYQDSQVDLRGMVLDMLSKEALTIEEAALSALLGGFGNDRALNRGEIEKLILYVGPKSCRKDAAYEISLGDIEVSLARAGSDAMGKIMPLIAGGNPKALAETLATAKESGASALGWLRMSIRLFMRLSQARSLMDEGAGAREAMNKLQPPVFYPETLQFEKWLRVWTKASLDQALAMLMEAELAAKTTGAPVYELAERTALRLSVMSARRMARG